MLDGFRSVFIPGPLPGLNEIISAHSVARFVRGKSGRKVRISKYDELKRRWATLVMVAAIQHPRMEPLPENSYFVYQLIEANRRRDPSNVLAGAMKIIEDGLQDCGVLANDGWRNVAGIQAVWTVGDSPGVRLFVGQCPAKPEQLESLK